MIKESKNIKDLDPKQNFDSNLNKYDARFNLYVNLLQMVKAKKIEKENFQKITNNVEIRNINELKILYLEVN